MFVLFIFIVLYFIYVEKEYPLPNFHLADFSGHFTHHLIPFIELHSFLFNFYGYSPYIYCFFFHDTVYNREDYSNYPNLS